MLPPGPSEGVLAQTVRLHRDPLGTLRTARDRYGPVFTVRLLTARPLVIVADPEEGRRLALADPGAAHAGEGRRRILPLASRRSVFGGDDAIHAGARAKLAGPFAAEAVAARRAEIAGLVERHVESWPRGRPFRALPRLRTLTTDVFVRVMLGVRDDARASALVLAIRRMLWTPGNPPSTLPGEGDGAMGAVGRVVFERRVAPVAALIEEELHARSGPREDILAARPSVEELVIVLGAAQEPPSSGLAWVLERIARQPGLAARFAGGADPRMRDAIVRETLRLNPPAFALLRRLTAPAEVAGVSLPAGVTVAVPLPLVHRDPTAFPDPDAFRPERWLDGHADESAFAPFGEGARRCLGEHLAHTYFDLVVPAVVRRLRLRAAWPRPERMVVRATTVVPHRSALLHAVAA